MNATIDCKIGYKRKENVQTKEFVCQENGEWNEQPYECEASCGQELNTIPIKGFLDNVSPLEVPWNAAIHRNGSHLCGGIIISGSISVFFL